MMERIILEQLLKHKVELPDSTDIALLATLANRIATELKINGARMD